MIDKMEGIIQHLATKHANGCADDAAQAARIAVWNILPKVKLNRSNGTINQFLVEVAKRAIYDEIRRQWNQVRRTTYTDKDINQLVTRESPKDDGI